MTTPIYSLQIQSVSPPGGLPGTIVTIAGSNFDTGFGRKLQVTFGGASADVIEVLPSRIITRVPPTAQSGRIRVSVAGFIGKRTISSQHAFVVNVGHPIKNLPNTAVRVGSEPEDIAFSPDGRWAYVVNTGSNDVSVVDFWTDQEIDVDGKPENGLTRIRVGDTPVAIAVTQDGTRAYVANRKSDDVSILDLQTRKELKRIDLGKGPLSTFTTLDGVELTRPLVREPIDVAISPKDDAVYTANEGSGDLSVISRDMDQVSSITLVKPSNWASVQGGKQPTSLAVAPDGEKAYVTMRNTAAIKVIDLRRRVVANTIDLHEDTPKSIVLSPDGRQA